MAIHLSETHQPHGAVWPVHVHPMVASRRRETWGLERRLLMLIIRKHGGYETVEARVEFLCEMQRWLTAVGLMAKMTGDSEGVPIWQGHQGDVVFALPGGGLRRVTLRATTVAVAAVEPHDFFTQIEPDLRNVLAKLLWRWRAVLPRGGNKLVRFRIRSFAQLLRTPRRKRPPLGPSLLYGR